MKQKDITLIVVIIILSAAVSLVLSNFLIGSPKKRQDKVEVVDRIDTDFQQPSEKYFNKNSIDPTKIIKIGDNPNLTPFKDKN